MDYILEATSISKVIGGMLMIFAFIFAAGIFRKTLFKTHVLLIFLIEHDKP